MICDASYQLMSLAGMTHLSDLLGGSCPPLSVHPLQDAAPWSLVMVCRPHLLLSVTSVFSTDVSFSSACLEVRNFLFNLTVIADLWCSCWAFSFIASRSIYCLSCLCRLLFLLIFLWSLFRRLPVECLIARLYRVWNIVSAYCGCMIYSIMEYCVCALTGG